MMATIKLAEDLATIWERARPERRKQLVAELFETIRIGGGSHRVREAEARRDAARRGDGG